MRVQAQSKYLKISAQKLRLSADLVRDAAITQAFEQLAVMPQKSAGMVFDTLKSAVANAEHNFNLRRDQLVIEEIRVDQGPKLKRFKPRSRGMANPIHHPMAHLTVVIREIDKPQKEEAK